MIKFLFLFLLTIPVFAQTSLMLGTGSLTPHITNSKKPYCNQWNDTGIIFNRTYYIRYGRGNHAVTYMQGEDSICSSIKGGFYTYRFYGGNFLDMGLIAGGYNYKEENWKATNDNRPAGYDTVDLVSVDVFGLEFVPILGIELSLHLIRGRSWSLKLNNILTPIITNHSLALEFRF